MPKRKLVAARRRGEPLSVRIDPKTRYGLELLSRLQRRSVTGVVEWAIAEALRNSTIADAGGRELTVEAALSDAWSVNELERLISLWESYTHLLTFDEERLVMVLLKTAALWHDANRRKYSLFRWAEVQPAWESLKPIAEAAAERTTVVGLTHDELKQAGLEALDPPFEVDDLPF
jgi:hypothetical protein